MRRRRRSGGERKESQLGFHLRHPTLFFFILGANRDGSDGRSGLIGELNPSLPFLFIFFLPPPIHFVKEAVWRRERRVVKLSRGISQVVFGEGEIGSADGEGVDQGVDFSPSKTKTNSFLQRNIFGGNVSPPAGTSEVHFLSGRSLHEDLRWRRRRRGKEVSNPTLSRFSSEGGIFGKFE